MKALATLLLAAMLIAPAAMAVDKAPAPIAVGPNSALITSVYQSVVLLYREDEAGGMHFTCTATAYKKTDKGYRFVSAAHCVEGDKSVDQKEAKYFVSNDEATKTFIPVTLVMAGDKKRGDDYSIWSAETKANFVVTPLGENNSMLMGAEVIDIAVPYGLGKQYFIGYVSNPKVDRPPLDAGGVQWHDVMLIMIGHGPGSSGSAVVSTDQKAIVAFLVGGTGGDIGAICVSVDAFKTFEALVDSGKYKKTPTTPGEAEEIFLGHLPFLI